MERHIQKRLPSTKIGFLFGCSIGFVIALGIMGISQRSIENRRTMIFGDIIVSTLKPKDANDQNVEELLMAKDGRPFLYACRNSSGKVTDLTLSNGIKQTILVLKASRTPGRWIYAQYGPYDMIGELYVDLDFDGQFDAKAVVDRDGKTRKSQIYYQEDWKQVDYFRKAKAISKSESFTFDKDTGWQLEKTGRK